MFLRRFNRDRLAQLGLVIIVINIIFALFPGNLTPYDPFKINFSEKLLPPSPKHPMGTDDLGRDVFCRILWGTRTALTVGICTSIITMIIGIIIGLVSAFFGGIVDMILMRFTDMIIIIPNLMFTLLLVTVFETRSVWIIILVLASMGWTHLARITRSEALSLKQRPYVEAATTMGASSLIIMFKHILPNVFSPIIVVTTLNLSNYILAEAGLSFLGLGPVNVISWGIIINAGNPYFRIAPWILTFPGLILFFLTLGINLFGDGLRDALDVKTNI